MGGMFSYFLYDNGCYLVIHLPGLYIYYLTNINSVSGSYIINYEFDWNFVRTYYFPSKYYINLGLPIKL